MVITISLLFLLIVLSLLNLQITRFFPVVGFFVILMILGFPPVFAENVSVSIPQGTSVPGCETTNECFMPNRVLLTVGDEVTWSNDDSAAHTVTAGSATDGPSGVFDSSLFMAGTTFSHKFDLNGEFPYFCMVHPWMQGVVLVGDAMAKDPTPIPIETPPPVMENKIEITINTEIVGGKVANVFADTDAQSLIIELDAADNGQITAILPRDTVDAKIGPDDDDFFVLVDGEEVDFEEKRTSIDRTLVIPFPKGAEEIEIIGTFVIPEFGVIVSMILAVSIISIIAISSESRLSIMPRF